METKSLLYGLIGFFIGGLIVSVVATTGDNRQAEHSMNSMSMDAMVKDLHGKTGDEFDEAFINGMIAHHKGAVEMAKMAGSQAKHPEIKQLSEEIITAQEKEITQMEGWAKDWGYSVTAKPDGVNH